MRPLQLFAISLLAFSCNTAEAPQPANAPLQRYELSDASVLALEDAPDVREELDRVLEEYFGEHAAPRLLILEEWDANGFDPNRSPFEGARPEFERQGATLDELRTDNRRAWTVQLHQLESRAYDEVGPFRARQRMSEDWAAIRDSESPNMRREARAFFNDRYPDLEESAQLFRVYCARCHGIEGGGDGPMAERFFPKPRNYQRGTFKFAGTLDSPKPRRQDLIRTMVQGLPGSAMPAFRSVTTAEMHGLVDYVRFLAVRGEVESMLVDEWISDDVPPSEVVLELYELVWERWFEAERSGVEVVAPEPDADPARWQLGRDVFLDAGRGNCFSCHGTEGKGDGLSAMRVNEEGQRFALLKDEWGDYILPRDFSEGLFRGGEQREDLYLRVYCGIPGTPMPSTGLTMRADGTPLLSDDEAWAVVDYVLSLAGKGPFAPQPVQTE